MEERCVCCGAIIPEGRMVCPACEQMQMRKAECELKRKEAEHQPQEKRMGLDCLWRLTDWLKR